MPTEWLHKTQVRQIPIDLLYQFYHVTEIEIVVIYLIFDAFNAWNQRILNYLDLNQKQCNTNRWRNHDKQNSNGDLV